MPEINESEDVPVRVPPQGFLTFPDDVTVGGGGEPYSGLGWSCLSHKQRQAGEKARIKNFPHLPITD